MGVRNFFIVLFAVLFLSACRKENQQVPLVAVDVTVNVNNPQFLDLTYVSGWEYLTGGSLGLIVYRSGPNEFIAYDRHSPYMPDEYCRISVSDDGQTIVDDTTCSSSSWLLFDGSLISGPAATDLQQYNTSFNDPFLRIYN